MRAPQFLGWMAALLLVSGGLRAQLLLPSAHRGREAGLCAEITLDGFQLSALDSKVLHIPERFTVLCVAKILHKSIVRTSAESLQVKLSNEINLCVPALRLEFAFADVVVACRAGKGEVVGEQGIERAQVLVFPRSVPLTDDLLVH